MIGTILLASVTTNILLFVLLLASIRRTRAYRDTAYQLIGEATAWKKRSALAEHEAQTHKQEAEKVRSAYANIIGRARYSLTNGYVKETVR